MSRIERIKSALNTAFSPDFIEIIDESAEHAGHIEAGEGEETHIHITIASPELTGLSRVKAHQAVYAHLAEEMANGLHAIRITIR